MPSDAWAAPLLQRRGGLYPGAAALAARLSFEAPSPDAEARESRSHGQGHHRWEVGEASLAEPSKRSENSTGASRGLPRAKEQDPGLVPAAVLAPCGAGRCAPQ